MHPPVRQLCAAVLLSLLLLPAKVNATILFEETFSDTLGGWTRGPEWEIGPAIGLPSNWVPWLDPDVDHTPGPNNGLAGTVIGGCPANPPHGYHYLTSPVIDLSGISEPKQLSFWFWLSTTYFEPDMDAIVEGWNGTAWQTLWDAQASQYYFLDTEWRPRWIDLAGFSNADFRVRFGLAVLSSNPYAPTTGLGGWSLDDVRVASLTGCPDADADGYLSAACGGLDCDDANAAVYPFATELCDGLDNDCDGLVDEGAQTAFYPDADGDGFGFAGATATLACTAPPGYVTDNGDCDDSRATIYPWAPELCDSLDNNCDGQVDEGVSSPYYPDADGDGYGYEYGVVYACSQPPGTITIGGDCDDTNPAVNPGAVELDDGIDNNCMGGIDEPFLVQRIRSIRDVPNDQGRAVRLRWRKNLREIIPSNSSEPSLFATYIVYRRVDPGQAQATRVRPEAARTVNLPPGEWDIVTSVPGTGDMHYQIVAPTLCDSTSSGNCRATFFVRAQWNQDYYQYSEDSAPDSGYSVDNIPPGVPLGLIAEARPTGNQLVWNAALDPDFQMFRIYRGADPSFEPGPSTLVLSTLATHWTDSAHGTYSYKVTAVDANGNESVPAAATAATGISGPPLSTVLAFSSLAPNPFSSTVTMAFDVPRADTQVELSIHDLAGRRVRTLVRGRLAAGRQVLTWDGRGEVGGRLRPGVYMMRLVGDGRAETRRVMLLP